MHSLKNLCEGLGFGPAVKTRSGFMKIWDSLKANVDNYQLQTSSTDNIDQSENQVNMNISDVPGGDDSTSTDDNVKHWIMCKENLQRQYLQSKRNYCHQWTVLKMHRQLKIF
ncbi:uncharacterized protein LOC127710614 [Mytilus californianus]|uniref:uncharacterized protein LOC127710614 n=1 Tax=Mytilus californianus TaxID=6549 RepID=UPI002245E62F|nr:uncharacterized protein LOC127710614 [Mytilus californianus]